MYFLQNIRRRYTLRKNLGKKVSQMLMKALPIERVGLIFEGVEVPHLHAKLIPIKNGENIKILLNSNFAKPSQETLQKTAEKIRRTDNR